jgi:hypothetical protein
MPRPLIRIIREWGGAEGRPNIERRLRMASGSTEKLVSCPGRKWSAEGQTLMATDGRRASVSG